MKTRKELDMENQKDQQEEQILSQESLQSLEEEQLQDVTGGGWGEHFLNCVTCGAFKQQQEPQPSSLVLSPGLNTVPVHQGTTSGSHQIHPPTPPALPDPTSGSPILGVVDPKSPAYGDLLRHSSRRR